MPQIPAPEDLGRVRFSGAAAPAQINPQVAYDIGRAGTAWENALHHVSTAFGRLAEQKKALDESQWLADRKIETLKADDQIRRETELSSGADGSGYEAAPSRLKSTIDSQEKMGSASDEARVKFKVWAAERTYDTGRWAANSAQSRLKTSTLSRLDTRLDELKNMTVANPDMSMQYFQAYQDEIASATGKAIDSTDATVRLEAARKGILKSGVLEKGKRNPTDWAKAMRALDDAGLTRKSILDRLPGEDIAPITGVLESGTTNPLKGLLNASKDTGGKTSYGNFGLLSGDGGSMETFVAKYGAGFDLTAKPGTKQFKTQWQAVANDRPEELRAAELSWYNKEIVPRVVADLKKVGVPDDISNDPRVRAYFGDRLVQYGPNSTINHAGRVSDAVEKSKGDPVAFLKAVGVHDRANLENDFVSFLATVPKDEAGRERALGGLGNRVSRREMLSLGTQKLAPSEAISAGVNLKDLPAVSGSIQPAELMSLEPSDFHAITNELRPFLATDLEHRMQDAVAANLAKGTQSLVTPEDLKYAPMLVGPKQADKWKVALKDSEETYTVIEAVKQMTPDMRIAQLNALVPTGNIEDLSSEERDRYMRWQKVVSGVGDAVRKNPYEWLTTQNESGRAALKSISDHTATQGDAGLRFREQAYGTLLKLQQDEGVDQKDIHLMSKPEAEKLVSELQTGDGNKGQIIDGLRARFGRNFDHVWKDLVRAGAPFPYIALDSANTKGQNALIDSYAVERVLMEKAGKDVDRGGLMLSRAGVTLKNLKKETGKYTEEFTKTFASPLMQEAYRDATERVTLKYMIDGEKNLSSAASRAANDVFAEKYTVVNGLRLPKNTEDIPMFSFGLRFSDNIIKKLAPTIVGQYQTSSGQYSEETRHQWYVARLMADRRWVTNENDTGAYLLDHMGARVMVKTEGMPGPKTVPLMVTWKQFSSFGGRMTPGSFDVLRSALPFHGGLPAPGEE